MNETLDRRTFIKNAATAGASLALLPASACLGEDRAVEGTGKSRIVEVSAPGIVGKNNRPDAQGLRGMVAQGLTELTGEAGPASAWRRFVKPTDVVGIKINSWGGRLISSKKPILQAVVEGVRSAGVPANRIIVWDQYEHNLRNYMRQQEIEPRSGGVRYEACSAGITKEEGRGTAPLKGFETDPAELPWGQPRLAELVANEMTAIINLAVLKDHITAGVSGALKNISHAVVDRPWLCHDNFCNPYIADIVNIPGVRDKLRLHIVDGVVSVAAGGPQLQSLDHLLVGEKLMLSTDPVALDRIGYDWISRVRLEKGFTPMETREDRAPGMEGVPGGYIATAAERGLGTDNRERIEIVRVG